MEIRIKAIHFDATEKLEAYIEKKVTKLEKHAAGETAEVVLKVVKPQTNMNKEVNLFLPVQGTTLHTEKVCDTFEEGIDQCIDAMKVQIEKLKDKMRNR